MARRRTVADVARGGEGIQAPRPSGTRLTTGVASVALVAAVAAYTAADGGPLATAGAGVAAAGAVVLIPGLVARLTLVVPWAVGLAGIGYVLGREHHRVADGWAALVGAGLLLAAELATWSIASDRRIHEEREVVVRRVLTIAVLVLASGLVSFVLVGAAAVSVSAGLLLTATGVAAAVGAVSIVLRLARG